VFTCWSTYTFFNGTNKWFHDFWIEVITSVTNEDIHTYIYIYIFMYIHTNINKHLLVGVFSHLLLMVLKAHCAHLVIATIVAINRESSVVDNNSFRLPNSYSYLYIYMYIYIYKYIYIHIYINICACLVIAMIVAINRESSVVDNNYFRLENSYLCN
jgi:hypothetical protein